MVVLVPRLPSFALRRFPELTRFGDANARADAFRRGLRKVFRSPYHWLLVLGYVIAVVVVKGLIWRYVPSLHGLESAVYALLVTVGGSAGTFWVFKATIEKSIRHELNYSGITTCMVCGYDLRYLPEKRCPECGSLFDPLV